jgi:class III poly(R)-hydroxyalkanoic acid synthase PhaE subunit
MGYTQKWQDQVQEALRLWVNYQKVQQEYTSTFSAVGSQAVDLLREKLFALSENGKSIESLRAIYNLWVECSEEAYGKIVNTEEYAEIYGRLINSLMAWKQHERCMVDEMLGALNMPTRQDLESMSARMQAMRREIKVLQVNQLVVEELRQEVSTLKCRLKKPSPVRKKSTSKTSSTSTIDKSSTNSK